MGDFKRPKIYTCGEYKGTLAQLCQRLHAGYITLDKLCESIGVNYKFVCEAVRKLMKSGYSKEEAIEKVLEEEEKNKEPKRRPIDPPDTGPTGPCPEYE